MTANNINNARNPITGMTISDVAHWTRWSESEEGKAMNAAFSREWASIPPANEGTVIGTARELLEIQHRLDKLKQNSILSDVEATLAQYGIS